MFGFEEINMIVHFTRFLSLFDELQVRDFKTLA